MMQGLLIAGSYLGVIHGGWRAVYHHAPVGGEHLDEPTFHVRGMLIVGRSAKVHSEQMDAPDRTLPIEDLEQPEET